MNIFIENLKYFKFLRVFYLDAKNKNIISKNNLLNIINNLSTLKLIENIKIEVMNKIGLDNNEEKNIIDCFGEIQIRQKDESVLIQLNKFEKIDIFDNNKISVEFFGENILNKNF